MSSVAPPSVFCLRFSGVLESAAMQTFDAAIVGAGVMGAAAACELAREGAKVALIDQSTLPNPRAASSIAVVPLFGSTAPNTHASR